MNRIEFEIKENIKIERTDNSCFEASVIFAENFIGFKGHFPANPILPGICIVKGQIIALEKLFERSCVLKEMISVKFYQPVLPGSCLKYNTKLEKNTKGEGIIVKTKVTCNEKRTAQLKLLVVY